MQTGTRPAEKAPLLTQTIAGSVESITFHSEQNGYTVLRFTTPESRDPITVTGNFSSLSPGESLKLIGWWVSHPTYGDQFKATGYEVTRPATLTGIQKYLGSGLIKGVGPVTAKRIVEHFGLTTLEIIEGAIERLTEVRGVSKKRVAMIRAAWEAQREVKAVMLFLQGHGVSTAYAVKIFKQYGNEAITIVERAPYRLASDIWGIGFKTADQIARNMGMPLDAEERLRAGLQYVLSTAGDEGHCYLPSRELVRKAAEALEVEDRARLGQILEALIAEEAVRTGEHTDDLAIYLPPLWLAEQALAKRLKILAATPVRTDRARIETWIDRYNEHNRITLSEEQRRAVFTAASERILVLTGEPGTGKTSTLRCLVALFKAMRKRVLLASPTGRAAQRLSEVTGEEAKTLHRTLAFDPAVMGFKHHDEAPLEADVVVVDEASMLDLPLANSLLKAVAPTSQLVLVGDVDQLPSVGPGTVLRDLIESGEIPVARLTEVFRQAAQSLIVRNAHKINQGEFPILIKPGESKADCYFIEAEEPEEIAALIVKTVSQSLPNRLGYHPLEDIQVLAPMNRGTVGATKLNALLQEALNPAAPGKAELMRGAHTFRMGDKVIQRVNNYKLEVFNGDLGVVDHLDLEEQEVVVRFADREVIYDYADVLELGHGFAVSVHKAKEASTRPSFCPSRPNISSCSLAT